jgi:CheY-like chemotaxis protein/HPt (histidine-containing phosphotransfer) domain-containing protein/anti-sigma regulatory factor (Ser/Thr protein kinase)
VLNVRASEKGISFSCRIPPEVPDALVGDQVRLRQILSNLAGNAIKFTERGEVTIGVRVESQGDEEACLEFAVRDTGIGILPADVERIFQPFAQADASTARRFGGTGLGLTICSNLVALMGGRIWAESEPGQGSTFYFTVRLPLAEELPPEPETPDFLTAATSKLRILLAEDNPANQKLVVYILQDRGHSIDVVGDGQEAICIAQENRHDVILMDVEMPGMDGLDATKAIRAQESGQRRVPIIAMTAHALKGDDQRCLAAGMDAYLSKPINGNEMVKLVEWWADHQRYAENSERQAVIAEDAANRAATGTPMEEGQSTISPPRPCESGARDESVLDARCPSTALGAPSCDGPESLSAIFNLDEGVRKCYGKYDLFQEMVGCLFYEADSALEQMRAALLDGDANSLAYAAHRFAGTVRYLGAQPASDATNRVEQIGRSGDLGAATTAVAELEHHVARLKEALAPHRCYSTQ